MTEYQVEVRDNNAFQQPALSILATPPGSPSKGQRYLVGIDATGDFSGQDNKVAQYGTSSYTFYTPSAGWLIWIEAEGLYYMYDGSNWSLWKSFNRYPWQDVIISKDYISPPDGYTLVTPEMTANDAPAPYIASAINAFNNYDAYEAFDLVKTGYAGWLTETDSVPAWIKMDLGNGNSVVITRYIISSFPQEEETAPKNWTLSGSNNDSDWTVIDTITDETGWAFAGESRTFEIPENEDSYRYYKMDITANNGHGGNRVGIGEIELYRGVTAAETGDRYIVGDSATGAWSGHDGEVAIKTDSGWDFEEPEEGWVAWITTEDIYYYYDGSSWSILIDPDKMNLWQRVGTTLSPGTAGDSIDLGAGDFATTGDLTLTKDDIGTTLAEALILQNTDTGEVQLSPSLLFKSNAYAGGADYPIQWWLNTANTYSAGTDFEIRCRIPSLSWDTMIMNLTYDGNLGVLDSIETNEDILAGANVGVGTDTFGTNADKVLCIKNGTIPSTSPADSVQFYAEDAASSYGTDEIPTMTSNTAPSGVASANSELNATYAAWKSMNDDGATSFWITTSGDGTGWLKYDFGSGVTKTIQKYSVQAYTDNIARSPKTWTLQGSNNDSDWTVLDTQTNASAFSAGEKREYTFVNAVAYRYFLLDVTLNQGDSNYLQIAEIELMEAVAGTSEAKVRDEAGNITTLSPHHFSLFTPDSSYEFPWSYYSRNDYLGLEINVDMFGAIRALEELTGKQFIYLNEIGKRDWDKDQQDMIQVLQDSKSRLIYKKMQEVEEVAAVDAVDEKGLLKVGYFKKIDGRCYRKVYSEIKATQVVELALAKLTTKSMPSWLNARVKASSNEVQLKGGSK